MQDSDTRHVHRSTEEGPDRDKEKWIGVKSVFSVRGFFYEMHSAQMGLIQQWHRRTVFLGILGGVAEAGEECVRSQVRCKGAWGVQAQVRCEVWG